MNASFRLSKSFIRCNDSSAESLRRWGRPSSVAAFAFFLGTTIPPQVERYRKRRWYDNISDTLRAR